ncbi:MAG: copper resistance protein B [Nitrospira sp.]
MSVRVLSPWVVFIGFLGVAIYAPMVSAESYSNRSLAENPNRSGTFIESNASGPQPQAADAEKQSFTLSSSGNERTLSNLSPEKDWPSPVNDRANRLFTLIDVLEYRPKTGGAEEGYRWDIEGWYGGDYNRLWYKSEGQQGTAFKSGYDVDFELLYGRFIKKYYDFQIGSRVETQTFRGQNVTRTLGVIGIEGFVPYDYDLEAALFIDQNGAVSGRLSFTKDFLLTQRLILQGRFETNVAVQRVEQFTTGSGLNNLEFGVRLRYEIRREFAPYIGFSMDKSFFETADLVRQQGGSPSQIRFVTGVRMWF